MVVILRSSQDAEYPSLIRLACKELPTVAVVIPFPLPSQMSSTPQASVSHRPFCSLSPLSVTCQEVNGIWNPRLLSPPCLRTTDHHDATMGLPPREMPRRRCLDSQGSSVHWPSPSGTLRESNDQAYHVLHTPPGHKGVFL